MTCCLEISKIKYRIVFPGDVCPSGFSDYECAECDSCVNIIITDEDVAWEREHSLELNYGVDILSSAILRKIAVVSLGLNRMLIHGAAIEYAGRAFLFTAPSGTGKTTHIKLWKKHLGESVTIINGDKPILEFAGSETVTKCRYETLTTSDENKYTLENKRCNSAFTEECTGQNETQISGGTKKLQNPGIIVHGTPWAGKERYQTNTSAPLCALIEVVRSDNNRMYPMKKADAFTKLYGHSFIPKLDSAASRALLKSINKIVAEVPAYVLECDMSDGAFKCAFENLTFNR